MLERISNKIDRTSYNLDVLEELQNIFLTWFFPALKKIELFISVLLEKNKKYFRPELLISIQKSLLVYKQIIVVLVVYSNSKILYLFWKKKLPSLWNVKSILFLK